ncbi:MFS transporter [Brevundimonas sp. EAKA]|jgi:maltose/moltooligosaccharide transporter|uniref:SLC45 family MFS transporter n=1 Tax=Brevundimonas mediterranea TaxID=74329 RepID=A0AB37E5J5_9CAUL|nr:MULTISPECIES: MFS transporter [Brevundimonas]KDP95372.1 MFS transporter [Brevundimonas sp. EAKA]MBA4331862.1 MFS transporter [Brevundimonas sp.]QIH72173.1 SLC45 family MFS transporter [Brevundimonas mediterranea]
MSLLAHRPRLSGLAIWNMCVGFFGIQIGFGLQNANTSRIFQTLGAEVDSLAILWIAAPLTGLLVQPIIGHFSDRTWTRFGRRRPYFLVGAIATTLALIAMPNSPGLWFAAAMLWIMDASINITMEPFRAFVGDNLPEEQRTAGYAMQSFFIGAGAVFASVLPWLLSNVFGVVSTAEAGVVPLSVKIAFYVGAAGLFSAVLWTVLSTREYSPEQIAAFERAKQDALGTPADDGPEAPARSVQGWMTSGLVCAVLGGLGFVLIGALNLEKELLVLAGFFAGFGLLQIAVGMMQRRQIVNAATEILNDIFRMPETMRGLAVVQFFSWFALFSLWIYTTAAVTRVHYGTTDTTSAAYAAGADWVGVLFGVYNGVAALAAFTLPVLATRIGRKATHALMLLLGAAGLFGVFVIRDPGLLWLPMIGVGFAWASIVSMPYAILSAAVPDRKMGVYMGVFNIFIVVPQLLAATVLGLILKTLFDGQAIWALVLGAVSFVLAAASALLVREHSPSPTPNP